MKVAVSIPDKIFKDLELLAEQDQLSRSALYTRALEEYAQRRHSAQITAQLNAVYDTLEDHEDDLAFVTQAARLTFKRLEQLEYSDRLGPVVKR